MDWTPSAEFVQDEVWGDVVYRKKPEEFLQDYRRMSSEAGLIDLFQEIDEIFTVYYQRYIQQMQPRQ